MARRANPPARRVSKHAIIGILSALVGITSVLNTNFAAASAALEQLDVTDASSYETLHAIAGTVLAGLSVATYWRGGIRGRKLVPRCTPDEARELYLVNVSDNDFNRHFRMPRELFYKFVPFVEEHVASQPCKFRETLPADVILAMCLDRLADGDGFWKLGRRYGMCAESARAKSHLFNRKLGELLLNDVVQLPVGAELARVIAGFEAIQGMPNCAGALDGTHIPWRCAEADNANFMCYKSFTSINTQFVVDHRGIVRSVCCGAAGGVTDATVFINSSIYKKMREGTWPVANAVDVCGLSVKPYIVADGIYPKQPYIVKPWRGAKCTLSKLKNDFNYKQSSTRQPVEHANGMIKRRFRILLKAMEVWDLKTANDTIVACVILHNILLSMGHYGTEFDPIHPPEAEEPVEVFLDDDADLDLGNVNEIRNALAVYLNSHRHA